MAHWGPELMEKEHQAKQTAQVLFFVIDKQTRSVATVIEAAYYTAAQKTFVLVIDPYQGPGQIVQGEPISQLYVLVKRCWYSIEFYDEFLVFFREYEDLSNGQLVLQDMVERLGIPVFNNVHSALESTAKVLRVIKVSSAAQMVD